MIEGQLQYARENNEFHLQRALGLLPSSGPEAVEAHFNAGFCYRVLALCALLEDADTEKFADYLCRSGHARLALLQMAAGARTTPAKFLCASRDSCFPAALAAGDLETATAIAALSPSHHLECIEYEDDFLFVHFLHRIHLGPEDRKTLDAVLVRWEQVLMGKPSGYLDVCKALLSGEEEAFAAGFSRLIDTRTAELEDYKESLNYNPEIYATEGQVFVEALAVLRIAELRKIRTPVDGRLVPSLARIPLGAHRPPLDAWKYWQREP